MSAATLTLTDFLLARIAEDERVVDNLISEGPWNEILRRDMSRLARDDEYASLDIGAGLVLAECEAKRRIVGLAVEAERRMMSGPDLHTDGTFHTVSAWMLDALTMLALPYADHPDYREEWRP